MSGEEETTTGESAAQTGAPATGAPSVETTGDSGNFDPSSYFVEGKPGEYDPEKIQELHNTLENEKTSKSYYQSQFMKKNNIPESPEGYAESFKADSSYEKHISENEGAQKTMEEMRKVAHENNINPKDLNTMMDYYFKKQVEAGRIDNRTPAQVQADETIARTEAMKTIQPMLDSLHRSKEENDQVIENFLNSSNIFTNGGEEMSKYINKISNDGSNGYKLITQLAQSIEHQGVPVVTGTIASKDSVALNKAMAAESDPVAREQLMKQFFKEV